MAAPVVVVIRDPDYSNEIEVYGDVEVIDVDLGLSFDGPKGFRAMDDADQAEWIDGTRQEVAHLPDDHPARQRIEQLIADMNEADA